MAKFLVALFWEFFENLPVILCLVAAVWFWAQGHKGRAVVCAAVGGIAGALAIRYLEPLTGVEIEPVGVTLVNVLGIAAFTCLFAAYLGSSAKWSNRKIDVLLGIAAGVVFALAQGLAAPGAWLIGVALHVVAIAVAGALVLIAVRSLKGRPLASALLSSLWVVLIMTVAISVIDYGYFLLGISP